VTGKKVNEDDLRAPVWGQPAETGASPLTLALPEGQSRPGARQEEAKVGDRVLPELVQNTME
jgi:hypothetical protein